MWIYILVSRLKGECKRTLNAFESQATSGISSCSSSSSMFKDLLISLSSVSNSFISRFSSESWSSPSTLGSLSAHSIFLPPLPLPLAPRPLLPARPPRPRALPRPLPRFISLFFFSMVLESLFPGWHPRAASRKTACTCPMNGHMYICVARVLVRAYESNKFCACTILGYLDKILIRIWPLYLILAAYLFCPFLQLFGNIFRHGNPWLHVLEARFYQLTSHPSISQFNS